IVIIKRTELADAVVMTVKRANPTLIRRFATFAIIGESRYASHLADFASEAAALQAHDELAKQSASRGARGGRMTALRQAALALAAKGMRVFPCWERSKEPITKQGVLEATTDPHKIEGWWCRREFNVAIATGPDSGIWVLDLDDDDEDEA